MVNNPVSKGANPDEINSVDGLNALHLAARNSEDAQILKMMLAHGANANKRTDASEGK